MLPEFETIARSAAVAFALLVPGASAAAGFEWHSVRYSRRRKDWVLRLRLFSGLWLGAGFWPWHWLAMNHWDDLAARRPVPWFVYVVPLGFVVVPYGAGLGDGMVDECLPTRNAQGPRRQPDAHSLGPSLQSGQSRVGALPTALGTLCGRVVRRRWTNQLVRVSRRCPDRRLHQQGSRVRPRHGSAAAA